ncbi:hypothetical protein [Haloferula helveola]
MKVIRTKKGKSRRKPMLIAVVAGIGLVSCGGDTMHNGRLPFSLLEGPPRAEAKRKVSLRGAPEGMERVAEHPGGAVTAERKGRIRYGDVVAFYMTHDESLSALSKGTIQKVPYELFRYGHVALVVPDPAGTGEPKLLQVAMKQAVNADEGLGYLDGKRWHAYRPPSGSVNVNRLGEFTRTVVERADDPKEAYDYGGVLGWKNRPWQPESVADVGESYSCATLVVAGLHYAGYELDAVHRGGRLDVVTPRQVIESRGWARADSSETLGKALGWR